MTDKPDTKPAKRSVTRARFKSIVKLSALETELWVAKNMPGTCEAKPDGLHFVSSAHTAGVTTIVPYSNVASYDVAE